MLKQLCELASQNSSFIKTHFDEFVKKQQPQGGGSKPISPTSQQKLNIRFSNALQIENRDIQSIYRPTSWDSNEDLIQRPSTLNRSANLNPKIISQENPLPESVQQSLTAMLLQKQNHRYNGNQDQQQLNPQSYSQEAKNSNLNQTQMNHSYGDTSFNYHNQLQPKTPGRIVELKIDSTLNMHKQRKTTNLKQQILKKKEKQLKVRVPNFEQSFNNMQQLSQQSQSKSSTNQQQLNPSITQSPKSQLEEEQLPQTSTKFIHSGRGQVYKQLAYPLNEETVEQSIDQFNLSSKQNEKETIKIRVNKESEPNKDHHQEAKIETFRRSRKGQKGVIKDKIQSKGGDEANGLLKSKRKKLISANLTLRSQRALVSKGKQTKRSGKATGIESLENDDDMVNAKQTNQFEHQSPGNDTRVIYTTQTNQPHLEMSFSENQDHQLQKNELLSNRYQQFASEMSGRGLFLADMEELNNQRMSAIKVKQYPFQRILSEQKFNLLKMSNSTERQMALFSPQSALQKYHKGTSQAQQLNMNKNSFKRRAPPNYNLQRRTIQSASKTAKVAYQSSQNLQKTSLTGRKLNIGHNDQKNPNDTRFKYFYKDLTNQQRNAFDEVQIQTQTGENQLNELQILQSPLTQLSEEVTPLKGVSTVLHTKQNYRAIYQQAQQVSDAEIELMSNMKLEEQLKSQVLQSFYKNNVRYEVGKSSDLGKQLQDESFINLYNFLQRRSFGKFSLFWRNIPLFICQPIIDTPWFFAAYTPVQQLLDGIVLNKRMQKELQSQNPKNMNKSSDTHNLQQLLRQKFVDQGIDANDPEDDHQKHTRENQDTIEISQVMANDQEELEDKDELHNRIFHLPTAVLLQESQNPSLLSSNVILKSQVNSSGDLHLLKEVPDPDLIPKHANYLSNQRFSRSNRESMKFVKSQDQIKKNNESQQDSAQIANNLGSGMHSHLGENQFIQPPLVIYQSNDMAVADGNQQIQSVYYHEQHAKSKGMINDMQMIKSSDFSTHFNYQGLNQDKERQPISEEEQIMSMKLIRRFLPNKYSQMMKKKNAHLRLTQFTSPKAKLNQTQPHQSFVFSPLNSTFNKSQGLDIKHLNPKEVARNSSNNLIMNCNTQRIRDNLLLDGSLNFDEEEQLIALCLGGGSTKYKVDVPHINQKIVNLVKKENSMLYSKRPQMKEANQQTSIHGSPQQSKSRHQYIWQQNPTIKVFSSFNDENKGLQQQQLQQETYNTRNPTSSNNHMNLIQVKINNTTNPNQCNSPSQINLFDDLLKQTEELNNISFRATPSKKYSSFMFNFSKAVHQKHFNKKPSFSQGFNTSMKLHHAQQDGEQELHLLRQQQKKFLIQQPQTTNISRANQQRFTKTNIAQNAAVNTQNHKDQLKLEATQQANNYSVLSKNPLNLLKGKIVKAAGTQAKMKDSAMQASNGPKSNSQLSHSSKKQSTQDLLFSNANIQQVTSPLHASNIANQDLKTPHNLQLPFQQKKPNLHSNSSHKDGLLAFELAGKSASLNKTPSQLLTPPALAIHQKQESYLYDSNHTKEVQEYISQIVIDNAANGQRNMVINKDLYKSVVQQSLNRKLKVQTVNLMRRRSFSGGSQEFSPTYVDRQEESGTMRRLQRQSFNGDAALDAEYGINNNGSIHKLNAKFIND